jgi:hypothetical protein
MQKRAWDASILYWRVWYDKCVMGELCHWPVPTFVFDKEPTAKELKETDALARKAFEKVETKWRTL